MRRIEEKRKGTYSSIVAVGGRSKGKSETLNPKDTCKNLQKALFLVGEGGVILAKGGGGGKGVIAPSEPHPRSGV